MPRIRLALVEATDGFAAPFDLPGIGPRVISNYRVMCRLRVGSSLRWHEAILDTGAPLTVIPRWLWQGFEGDFTRLPFADGSSSRVGRALGSRYDFVLARVTMTVKGQDDIELAPVPVVAAVVVGGDDPPFLLAGLKWGVCEGRHLIVSPADGPTAGEAWLQDEPPEPHRPFARVVAREGGGMHYFTE